MYIINKSDSKHDILTFEDTRCKEDDHRAASISTGGCYGGARKGCSLGRRCSRWLSRSEDREDGVEDYLG